MNLIQKIEETTAFIRNKGVGEVDLAIVLGTGLGKLVDEIEGKLELNYSDIPNFPIATVEFHSGKMVYGTIHGKRILALAGRFHFYEGYSMEEITFPIRIFQALKATQVLLSNAAGMMNLNFKKGSLMLLDDHISLLPANPLVGHNYPELGPRFPDMSAPYSKSMNAALLASAERCGIDLNVGVYVSVTGPNLETRAEYRFLRGIGADAVGMSTVPEVIVAKHAGLPCACISVLTDECDPDNLKEAKIDDIIATAGKAEISMIALIKDYIKNV